MNQDKVKNKPSESHIFGKQSEDMAAKFLEKKGYQILERNYRYRKAEVDIICLKEQKLVVVEVKARSYNYYGTPETFVTKNKIRLLIEATNYFISENNFSYEVQFDIISIEKRGKEEVFINHIEDAFNFL